MSEREDIVSGFARKLIYNPQAMCGANWKTWLEKALPHWVSVGMRFPHLEKALSHWVSVGMRCLRLNMTQGLGGSSHPRCAMPQASISSIRTGWTWQDLVVLWSTRDQWKKTIIMSLWRERQLGLTIWNQLAPQASWTHHEKSILRGKDYISCRSEQMESWILHNDASFSNDIYLS